MGWVGLIPISSSSSFLTPVLNPTSYAPGIELNKGSMLFIHPDYLEVILPSLFSPTERMEH